MCMLPFRIHTEISYWYVYIVILVTNALLMFDILTTNELSHSVKVRGFPISIASTCENGGGASLQTDRDFRLTVDLNTLVGYTLAA